MTNSPNLILPYIDAAQSQKHVTHNDAIRKLDAIINPTVIAMQTTPPGSPVDGDCYIVATGGTGAWATKDTNIAAWQDGVWYFYPPRAGWKVYIQSLRQLYNFDPFYNTWKPFEISTANGSATYWSLEEQEITLSGANTASTTAQIRNRDVVFGVSCRTTLAVTGATSYSVGVTGNTGQFGSGIGIALGSNNVGVIGPTAFYADTPILITSAGANFTGGKVRVAIHSLRFAGPQQ